MKAELTILFKDGSFMGEYKNYWVPYRAPILLFSKRNNGFIKFHLHIK